MIVKVGMGIMGGVDGWLAWLRRFSDDGGFRSFALVDMVVVVVVFREILIRSRNIIQTDMVRIAGWQRVIEIEKLEQSLGVGCVRFTTLLRVIWFPKDN